ncbi:MAG: type VI secretion system-associated protein TagF [Erythrobacter sp.]|nr:type VI secretion system-associated protein TagF [Erythrobacter sp.]
MPADAVTMRTKPKPEAGPAQRGSAISFPALVGKLPAHGDFVSRGVTHAARDLIDHWLSDWMTAARSALGEAFEERYGEAGPWLFEGPTVRLLALPSIDKAGRLFPLLALYDARWKHQRVYDSLVTGIAEGSTCDALHGELAEQAGDEEGEGATQPAWFQPEGSAEGLPCPGELASWHDVERMLA